MKARKNNEKITVFEQIKFRLQKMFLTTTKDLQKMFEKHGKLSVFQP